MSGKKVLNVYTDGCCHNNGKGKASAGIGVYWGPGNDNNVSERLQGRQTNNRAEITAATRAVGQAKDMKAEAVVVNTDSEFLINSATKWMPKWKENGWKTVTGKPVANREELQELDYASQGIRVHYNHVRGHSGVEGNERADALANEGARQPYSRYDYDDDYYDD